MSELLPCPFCKHSTPLFVQEIVDGNDRTIAAYVKCDACDTQGPECASLIEAHKTWNDGLLDGVKLVALREIIEGISPQRADDLGQVRRRAMAVLDSVTRPNEACK